MDSLKAMLLQNGFYRLDTDTALAGAPFALTYMDDFEKAKEWLVGRG